MKRSNYKKLMSYLDIIETEMNKVAKAVGHPSYEEFFSKTQEHDVKKAA